CPDLQQRHPVFQSEAQPAVTVFFSGADPMSSQSANTPAITLSTLNTLKQKKEKFTCLTAYDSTFTRQACLAGVETLLVGDSLGMVLQGHESTLPVTLEQMAYHTACVHRANQGALLITDMPFMSYASEN